MYSDPISDAVNAALDRLAGGASVEEIEGQLIDCKELLGSVARDGTRLSSTTLSPSAKDDAARQLATEVACLAHGGGGALLVGVRDDRRGSDALVGTDLDPDWLRLRIHELTIPSLTVAINAVEVPGVELAMGPVLVVQVPPAVELHGVARGDGTGDRPHRWRVGRACLPMSTADQAVFLQRVRPMDWSAQRTSLSVADADVRALEVARSLQPSLRAVDNEELLTRLGVLDAHGRLSRAGALLFCRSDQEIVVFTVHDVPGAPSRVGRVAYDPPLLVAFDELLIRLETVLPVALLPAAGAQRGAFRSVPISVVREALANAFAHRDWNQPSPIIVSVTTGSVAEVVSPGGFPDGVTAANLLSHPSRPTNPALAHALALLQVAERQGVGVDLMFREMIHLGHAPPEIDAVGTNVRCRIVGGPPDPGAVELFSTLGVPLLQDVETAIALHLLRGRKDVDAAELAPSIQRSETVAAAALQRAADNGLVERVTRVSTRWRLTKATRLLLAPKTAARSRRTTDELALEVVRFAQGTSAPFSRAEVEVVLHVAERRARQILEELADRRWITTVGATTGRSVRYARGSAWNEATSALRSRP